MYPEALAKRRFEFYSLMSRGSKLVDAVGAIHLKYGISKSQLYGDWAKRKEWGLKLENLDDADMIVQDTLISLVESKRRLWKIIDVEDDKEEKWRTEWPFRLPELRDRMRALVEVIAVDLRALSAAQSVGLAKQEPIKIDIMERAEKMHDKLVELCGDDVGLQEKVIAVMYDLAQSEN